MSVHPAPLHRLTVFSGIAPCAVLATLAWPAPWTQSVVSNGFNNPSNTAVTALAGFTVHGSSFLYAATANDVEGARLYRSTDGVYWTAIGETGLLGSSHTMIHVLACARHAVHGQALYIGTRNETAGAELWRSTDTFYWRRCGTTGFGNHRNVAIRAVAVADGWMYVGTENPSTGAEIWKSSDATTWAPVMIGGFGDPATTAVLCFAVTESSHLIAGTRNAITGGGLWVSSDGVSWTRAGLPGLGNPDNTAVSALTVFNTTVLAGTSNDRGGAELWYSTDTIVWSRASLSGAPGATTVTFFFGYDHAPPNYPPDSVETPGVSSREATGFLSLDHPPRCSDGGFIYCGLAGGGAQVIRSADGAVWGFPVAETFGVTGNTAVHAIAAFNRLLYFGTQNNTTGGQIHRGRLYRISGTVADGAGNRVNGVQIDLSGLEHRTTATGYRYQAPPWRYDPGIFSIDNLFPGLYTLTPSLTGHSFSPGNRQIGVYFDIDNIPFTVSGLHPRFSISGTVRDAGGSPVPNVLITLDDGAWTVRTAADGTYSFVQLDGGWHTVTPSLSSTTVFVPPLREYTNLDASCMYQDFIVHGGTPPAPCRIVGTVRDRFHRGIPEVRLHLSGMLSGTFTTDGDGRFFIENLPIGSYVLTPHKDGYTFTPECRSYLPLVRDADGQTFHEAIAATLDELVCAPNPVRTDRGDVAVVFSNLPDRVSIRIHTLAGVHVRTIEKDNQIPYCTWDLRNSAWKPVATGVYLYTVTDGAGRSRSGRIAVIR